MGEMKRKRNPMQPIVIAEDGVVRFQANRIVQAMLDHCSATGLDLNDLTVRFHGREFRDDWNQFAQLHGYSVGGFCSLSYARSKTILRAEAKAQQLEDADEDSETEGDAE